MDHSFEFRRQRKASINKESGKAYDVMPRDKDDEYEMLVISLDSETFEHHKQDTIKLSGGKYTLALEIDQAWRLKCQLENLLNNYEEKS